MADIDDEATMREFRQLTGMLPPGRDEASAAIGQHNYDRGEVRWLLWEMYCKLERQLAAKDAEIKDAQKAIAEARVEIMEARLLMATVKDAIAAKDAEIERLRAVKETRDGE